MWLCLHFAKLALEIFSDRDHSRPLAVVAQRVVHCANRDNLEPGLAVATAQALYPDLIVAERQSEREREALLDLAHWAYRFTPSVVLAAQNSLLLEIGSCRRLYRGTKNLLEKIEQSLQAREQYAVPGLAHTPKAAWLLAHCHCQPALQRDALDRAALQRQLQAVPVAALDIDNETQLALQQMGLMTLAQLRALPSAALGKRFGAALIDYLQKLWGEVQDPQRFFTPAPRFQRGLAFIDGIAQRQMLLFPMKRLLQALDDYLRARQLRCHRVHWQLFDAQRLQAEFSLELSRERSDWQTLLELSRIKLEQIVLTELIFSINLHSEDFFEAAPIAAQLFPDANDQRDAAAALLDRLQARLGSDALQSIQAQESHWPELAWRYSDTEKLIVPTNRRSAESFATTRREYVPIGSVSASMPTTVAANNSAERLNFITTNGTEKKLRPLWLLPTPQQLPQRDDKPYWQTALTLLRGPERIGNHWWQETTAERDYYIARNERGTVCWIFCDRSSQQWFLHGLFA